MYIVIIYTIKGNSYVILINQEEVGEIATFQNVGGLTMEAESSGTLKHGWFSELQTSLKLLLGVSFANNSNRSSFHCLKSSRSFGYGIIFFLVKHFHAFEECR